jgi:DNA-binding SARP family transcriptional activator
MLERADLMDSYGNPDEAEGLLAAVESASDLNLNDRVSLSLQLARQLSRRGRHDEARAQIPELNPDQYGGFAGQSIAILGTSAYVAVAAGSSDADVIAERARQMAGLQGAGQWRRIADLLCATRWDDDQFAATVKAIGTSSPWNLTYVADLIGRRLDDLDETGYETVAAAARLHPGRWRFVLRRLLANQEASSRMNGARLLESIGERADIRRLRSFARSHRKMPGASAIGRGLARRLADRVFVDDLNRVTIHVGERQISGSAVRRKVLGLLCFLLTKPDLAATRDQVLDALWPDLDPIDAVNSLNQTVYFLRRILEEDYVDDLSPGYLHHDSDLIWFDPELLTSRSNESRRLIKSFPPVPTPEQVTEILKLYSGRFAMDFEYEEWAAPHRDWLHASFLEVVERAVMSDIETGHFDRGIRVARQVLDIDPSAEQVEVSLLRLYRATGAHAAAAEQYGHYAAVMRDQLGVEPLPLESL